MLERWPMNLGWARWRSEKKWVTGAVIRGLHRGRPTDEEPGPWAVYGDSPRQSKALRHAAWPDNGEHRWCQRDWPRWDTTAGENSGRSLSPVMIFLTEERYQCLDGRESRRQCGSRHKITGGEGGRIRWSCSVTVPWWLPSECLTDHFVGLGS
jgi:hypothetical protein